MFEFDVRLCCECLCIVGACLCFAVVVGDWCLSLMLGYVVVGYGKLMFVFDLPCLLMVSV